MIDIPDITLNDLTDGKIDGNGVFDKLMQASKAHLDAEFKKGAIKGAEYSEVYLGQVQAVLNTALQFLTVRPKIKLEVQLLSAQVDLAAAQLLQTQAQVDLVRAQIEAAAVDKQLTQAQAAKVNAETLNVPKQGLQITAQTALIEQQKLNEVQQHEVLVAQECLLKAQFDNTEANVIKTSAETNLLNQKTATERAQILSASVDPDSVVGRQKDLYLAQTNGFTRDSEQKAAKILIDTWNVRRTTDDGTVADSVNMLNDTTIGRAVQALIAGINA